MKTQVNQMNNFLFGLIKVVGFVSIAYLANFLVAESFGGVNPLIEFSPAGISKIESTESKHKIGLGAAYEACKDKLIQSSGTYEFPDQSYQAWDLSDGRFLIESRVYSIKGSGSSAAANLMCRVLKTEDDEFFASHWKVQGIQVSML